MVDLFEKALNRKAQTGGPGKEGFRPRVPGFRFRDL